MRTNYIVGTCSISRYYEAPSDSVACLGELVLFDLHESGSWNKLRIINSPIAHGFPIFLDFFPTPLTLGGFSNLL